MTDLPVQDFARLFRGRADAYGSGGGRVIRGSVSDNLYQLHLWGKLDGLGIFPLLDDSTCWFGAIDLDEPDFEAARDMQQFLPGYSWIERSRSGNAHVWVFFTEPAPAWAVRGILRDATLATGKRSVEVFPKQDGLREGMVGNYINLPYHGDNRPILDAELVELPLHEFVRLAIHNLNVPRTWLKRADWLGIVPPEQRDAPDRPFGTSPVLHECAEHIIEGALSGERPIVAGHRAVVFFNLAKMLGNYEGFDLEEVIGYLRQVNDESPDPIPLSELQRIVSNVERGGFRATGCDDPLMAPYVRPDCPIAGSA